MSVTSRGGSSLTQLRDYGRFRGIGRASKPSRGVVTAGLYGSVSVVRAKLLLLLTDMTIS